MKNPNIWTSNIDRLVGLKKIHVDWLMEPDKIVTTSMVPRFLSLFFCIQPGDLKGRKMAGHEYACKFEQFLTKVVFFLTFKRYKTFEDLTLTSPSS